MEGCIAHSDTHTHIHIHTYTYTHIRGIGAFGEEVFAELQEVVTDGAWPGDPFDVGLIRGPRRQEEPRVGAFALEICAMEIKGLGLPG